MQPLNFAAQPEKALEFINSWTRNETKGKIPELLQEISADTKLIIANTLYYKGSWLNAFDENLTDQYDFYPQGYQQPPVQKVMMQTDGYFPYHESAAYNCTIVGLPYRDGATTMYVIVPHNSTPSKLRQLQATLSSTIIEELLSKMWPSEINLHFPKMTLSGSFNLRNILSRLGIQDIFKDGVSDLSLMESDRSCDMESLQLSRDAKNRFTLGILEKDRVQMSYRKSNLFVDEIVHKVQVDVDEEGTEGAAATAALQSKMFTSTFRVNTPFMFLIRHDLTKLPLFYGVVNEP